MSQIKRILIIRLSSLGDIVLSQDSLKEIPFDIPVDWLVKKGSEIALISASSLQKIHLFERGKSESSFGALIRTAKLISREKYSIVLDLHSVPKTKIIRILLRFYALAPYQWYRLPKPRMKRLAFALLKKNCPTSLRPGSFSRNVRKWARRSLEKAGMTPVSHPVRESAREHPADLLRDSHNLSHFGNSSVNVYHGNSFSAVPKDYFGISPGSVWTSKQWSIENFRQICLWVYQTYRLKPLLIGLSKEAPIQELKKLFSSLGIPFEVALDIKSSRQLETPLLKCAFVLSNDSFAAHFSESLGVPVVMLFGPTDPDYGFGPKLPASRPVHTSLWCSPCSKDGSLCFRTGADRFLCLKYISPAEVKSAIKEVLTLGEKE